MIGKIGFTNRTLWAEYGVYSLLWGYVHDSTVKDLGADALEVSLSGSAEPRIEPEIVFGLAGVAIARHGRRGPCSLPRLKLSPAPSRLQQERNGHQALRHPA